jgi:hypothetical protein
MQNTTKQENALTIWSGDHYQQLKFLARDPFNMLYSPWATLRIGNMEAVKGHDVMHFLGLPARTT